MKTKRIFRTFEQFVKTYNIIGDYQPVESDTVCQITEFWKPILSSIGTYDRVLFNVPRGKGKSTLLTIFLPIWAAVTGKEVLVLLGPGSEALASERLKKIKELLAIDFLDDDEYKYLFNNKNEIRIGGKIMIRMRHWAYQPVGIRPDLIIFDDVETIYEIDKEDSWDERVAELFKNYEQMNNDNKIIATASFNELNEITTNGSAIERYAKNNNWACQELDESGELVVKGGQIN